MTYKKSKDLTPKGKAISFSRQNLFRSSFLKEQKPDVYQWRISKISSKEAQGIWTDRNLLFESSTKNMKRDLLLITNLILLNRRITYQLQTCLYTFLGFRSNLIQGASDIIKYLCFLKAHDNRRSKGTSEFWIRIKHRFLGTPPTRESQSP